MTLHWHDLGAFLAMGGYGLYVWGSFAMVAVAAGWEAVLLAQRRRRALDDLSDPDALAATTEAIDAA